MRAPNPCLYAIALTFLLCPGMASAHPFHISSAEMEYDSKTDRLQTSLRVQAIDFEQALSKMVGERITLEQTNADEWIVAYLQRHFYLTPASAQPARVETSVANPREAAPGPDGSKGLASSHSPLEEPQTIASNVHWVGRELKGAWLWLYFELELPSTSNGPVREGLRLVNTVLCECNANQINTVSVRYAGQRQTLKMTSQQPSREFRTQWMTP